MQPQFQNRRNRLRNADRELEIKRLPPGQAVNIELIEAKIKAIVDSPAASDHSSDIGVPVENTVGYLKSFQFFRYLLALVRLLKPFISN